MHSFFDVTVWARQAEDCEAYLSKGRGVRMVGRLKQDRWADPEGKTHFKAHVIAEHVEFKSRFKNKPEDREQEHGREQEADPFQETEPAPVEEAAAL